MLKFGMNKSHNLLFQAFFSEYDYIDSFMIYIIILWKLGNITTQPHFTKGWEPLELSMVFNPDPSQLSFKSLKKYSLFRNYHKTCQKLCNIQKKVTNFCLYMRYADHKKTLNKYGWPKGNHIHLGTFSYSSYTKNSKKLKPIYLQAKANITEGNSR